MTLPSTTTTFLFTWVTAAIICTKGNAACIVLVDKFGIFIVVLVACVARNHCLSYNFAVQNPWNKRPSQFLNSGLLLGILKCRLCLYFLVIIFNLLDLHVCFLNYTNQCSLFSDLNVFYEFFTSWRHLYSFVRCIWDSKENSEGLILVLLTPPSVTVNKRQPLPPLLLYLQFPWEDLKID